MRKQNLMAFAIALIVMFSISMATAFVPIAPDGNRTSFSKSVLTDTVSADFSFSDESKNRATVKVPQKSFQAIAITRQNSGFIARETRQFQLNYPDFTALQINSPPDWVEIVPNWQNCKTHPYFVNDYKPELVWRE